MEMKIKKCINILIILLSMSCVSCSWLSKSDNPMTAMNALAWDAERNADKWSESEMKEKFARSNEIIKNFNEKKKDYDKDDFRQLIKDHEYFCKAIAKTKVGKELKEEGYFEDEIKKNTEIMEIMKELSEYYGPVND